MTKMSDVCYSSIELRDLKDQLQRRYFYRRKISMMTFLCKIINFLYTFHLAIFIFALRQLNQSKSLIKPFCSAQAATNFCSAPKIISLIFTIISHSQRLYYNKTNGQSIYINQNYKSQLGIFPSNTSFTAATRIESNECPATESEKKKTFLIIIFFVLFCDSTIFSQLIQFKALFYGNLFGGCRRWERPAFLPAR